MSRGKPYQPPAGQPTAGQLRHATLRAFTRSLTSTEPPADLIADELTRRALPNRAQRRAFARRPR